MQESFVNSLPMHQQSYTGQTGQASLVFFYFDSKHLHHLLLFLESFKLIVLENKKKLRAVRVFPLEKDRNLVIVVWFCSCRNQFLSRIYCFSLTQKSGNLSHCTWVSAVWHLASSSNLTRSKFSMGPMHSYRGRGGSRFIRTNKTE